MKNSKGAAIIDALQCPIPTRKEEFVVLGHGGGGRLTDELVRTVFLPALANPQLERGNDSAEIAAGGNRLVFTTDSFVVSPLTFPGGDIGALAVKGTINDLAVVGARPLGLSAAFIIEEGFPISRLRAIAQSMGDAAREAQVEVIAADTKVVERGKADGLFITTSGVGIVPPDLRMGPELAEAGDAVIVSGPIGDHGIAVMSLREGLDFDTEVVSDCAALHGLTLMMLSSGASIRCMRDATRGGVATVLNEIAMSSGTEIEIDETAVPVRGAVRAACELLGLDPLYVACEGRLVAVVAKADADRLLGVMRSHPLGSDAVLIGRVTGGHGGRVLLRTALGSARIIDTLPGDQLPRIC